MYTAKMVSTANSSQRAPLASSFSALLVACFVFLLAVLAISDLKPPRALPATAPQNEFSAERALTHVRAIAAAPHPIGSSADAAVRTYLEDQLSKLGMNPQVATAVGIRNGSGALVAANTHDVMARLQGTSNSGAVMLMAHYDSVPSGPGAADDAAGVAAILETVRALRAGPPLKNDVIVLFTDGEEAGLLGAEAFVASHPSMKDIGLLMNFEARGNSGPSLLFETSANNALLIRELSSAAPYPVGSSLFYALYKLLPNDTDFTEFRPAHVPGLNFAFGSHLEAYHSWLDTADNLDTSSLQHHGSYALSLVRHFGQEDLGKFRQQSGDDIFFDWLGSHLIVYSERWVIIWELLATVLLLLNIFLNVRNGKVRVGRIAVALVACLSVLIIVPVMMFAVGWLFLRLLAERLLQGDTSANSLLLTGFVLLGAAAGCFVWARIRSRFYVWELSLGGLTLLCILNWVVAILFPPGSYVLLWPLLFTVIGTLALTFFKTESPRAMVAGTVVGTITTVLLCAPLAYLLYIFLTLNVLSIAAVGLLVGILLMSCIPLISVAATPSQWRSVILPLLAGTVICLGLGVALSHSSAQHPRQDTLLYSLDADHHAAVWASPDRAPDSYTAQFLGDNGGVRRPIPDFLAGSRRAMLSAPASLIDAQPPVSEVNSDQQDGDVHTIHMRVRSQRDAELMLLRFDTTVKPLSVKISGRTMTVHPDSIGLTMLLYGMGAQGADLELTLNAPSGVSFWLSDYSSGLPTIKRRNSDLIAAQGSDQTLISRKYTLDKSAPNAASDRHQPVH